MKLSQIAETQLNVPKRKQTTDFSCGPVAVFSVLKFYDPKLTVTEQELCDLLGTTNKRGTDIDQIVTLGKKLGMRTIAKTMDIKEVQSHLDQRHPVILNLQDWHESTPVEGYDNGHYVVATGHTDAGFEIMDPLGGEFRTFIPYDDLERRWYGGDEDQHFERYGIVLAPSK